MTFLDEDDPRLRHRRDDIDTSVEAAHTTDTNLWFSRILKDMEDFPDGCIQDDILARYDEKWYGSITPRFAGLCRKNLIHRTEERRMARSGRRQSVMRLGPAPTLPATELEEIEAML